MELNDLISASTDLNSYLLTHEEDIAAEVNDFGDLKSTFSICIGRNPISSNNNAPDFLIKGKELLNRRNEIGEEAHEKELEP